MFFNFWFSKTHQWKGGYYCCLLLGFCFIFMLLFYLVSNNCKSDYFVNSSDLPIWAEWIRMELVTKNPRSTPELWYNSRHYPDVPSCQKGQEIFSIVRDHSSLSHCPETLYQTGQFHCSIYFSTNLLFLVRWLIQNPKKRVGYQGR